MEHAVATTPNYTSKNFLIDYEAPQMQLIKDTYAAKASKTEFELLIYMSRIYGLDVLTRKIWCVKYGNNPAQIFAGRDGFLEIAHRDPNFDGMKTTVEMIPQPFTVRCFKWENDQKKFFDKTFDFQFVATCQVFRKDKTRPFEITVWEEEYSTGMDNWEKKRRTMISKVAESQCLRKAFSISGMYAPEEIGEDGQAPDIIHATVMDAGTAESSPLALDLNKVGPKDEDEEAKRLKHIRGKLNQALLVCKDAKESRKIRTEFQSAHGKKMWEVLTGHKPDETFLSMAMEHEKRIKDDSAGPSWTQRMNACATFEEFQVLQAEYIADTSLESNSNNDLINEKGAFFGAPGYEDTKGME